MVPDDEFFNVPEKLPFDISSPDETQISEDYEDHSSEYMEPCEYTCKTVDDFLRLTDNMVETIIGLEDELVRWRQALIKYLPERWAEGLRMDIFCNLSRDFEGDPAYDLYVKLSRGEDPQHDKERTKRLYRLADGTDETSIDYL
jgi:hypothetical protein